MAVQRKETGKFHDFGDGKGMKEFYEVQARPPGKRFC
jgi:hypothetical protein